MVLGNDDLAFKQTIMQKQPILIDYYPQKA